MWSPEEFADSVTAVLRSQLPAALAEQTATWAARDAAANREITLTPPPDDAYEPGGVSKVTRYPTVEVAAPDVLFSNYSLGQEDADVGPALIVRVWDRDPRHGILYRRMNRLAAAVYQVLASPGVLAGATIETARISLRFNPETEEYDGVVSAALIAFILNDVQLR